MRWVFFFTACVLAAAQPVCAQTTRFLAPRGVPGILDPITGKFRVTAPTAAIGANTATVTGRFVFNITITIVSPVPANAPIACSVDANAFDSGSVFSEVTVVPAIRRGATATCTAVTPYAWPVSTPAADIVSLGYSVSSQSLALTRESIISLPPIKLPGNGATTTRSIATVL